jgi:YVTN family beta-propeller protein
MKPTELRMIMLGAGLALLQILGCAEAPDWLMVQKREPAALEQLEPLKPRIYVANESSNSVTVIDAASYQVVGTIDAKNHSTHDLALTRDGSLLFATNLASGRLSVIDTRAMETIGSIYTGNRCHVVTLTNDNRQAWVANIGEDNISIVDLATFRILGTIAVGKGPTGLTFSQDGRFAYVSNQGDKTVSVIDTASNQVIKSIPVGANPHFLVVSPDGKIWGTNTGGSEIYVIDPEKQDKVATFDVGAQPQQIAFAFRGMQGPLAYVSVGSLGKVIVVNADIKNLKVVDQIEVGQGPNGIWASPEGTRVFVAHDKSNDLRVIDTGTSQVIATVPVGRKPIRVVVSR